MTMEITITINAEQYAALLDMAGRQGKTPEQVAFVALQSHCRKRVMEQAPRCPECGYCFGLGVRVRSWQLRLIEGPCPRCARMKAPEQPQHTPKPTGEIEAYYAGHWHRARILHQTPDYIQVEIEGAAVAVAPMNVRPVTIAA